MAITRYRVAQWGTGNVGLRSLAAIIDHPKLELVALKVYSQSKVGRDAGALCGIEDVGILASKDIEAIIASRPDCVVYMPDKFDQTEVEQLLNAGVNVATALIGFNHRDSIEFVRRSALEDACRKGGTSLYSTGSSPGWSTEIMPLTLLAMQRRLDCLTISDFADMSSRNSPDMLTRLNFGVRLEDVDRTVKVGTSASTPPTFRALAEAIGMPIDDITTSVEYAVAKSSTKLVFGTIEAGTIGAMRMGIIGLREGKPLLRRFSTWYVVRDLEPQWELRSSGWRMQLEGDTSLDVAIAFDVEQADYARYSPGLTAHPVVNSIPFVCAAKPGILQTSDLPMIIPYLGR